MNERVDMMKREMQDVVENNILRFWLDQMMDYEHGGFYGRMDGNGELHKDAEKGAILNARILWAFSAAFRVLKHPEYLEAATRAKDYIIEHFIDQEYGGVYWSVDCEGNPLDTKKQFYAIGFMIYGLTEYARATGDREALDYALDLYDCIEEHAFDSEHNGYIEACTREWGRIEDMRLSDLDANYPKSQNTHLHIIEPYTNLLRCLKEAQAKESCDYVSAIGSVLPVGISVPPQTISEVEGALRNLVDIFTEKILNKDTNHLDLFFGMDWTRGAGHLESYGHDIECSWLLHEAALVLGDQQVLNKVEPIVQAVAQASAKGLRPDGSLIHEANLDTGYVDDDLHWWVQAENVVGWYNIWQHFGDEEALNRAEKCWHYIKKQLIDYEHGEWYWSRHANGLLNTKDDKAGFWKCPYHNSRMCLEIIER
ncbi:mannobiose 2-epimerase [Prevotella sp. khp1]|uniref:AGE family epimerase/isomerase n=1 Tax=Prevotellaceae TaxID=171552 RepID=UPI00088A630D|nr:MULTISPECIES: AGE family epimerase/isomerase [Prevotellaceae]QVJ80426.1 AGE family epimerase/isomerase [Xylanibacter ruminicola]SDQ22096.1 mannobiose 2-epimerase [Prevotella sp. khp1]